MIESSVAVDGADLAAASTDGVGVVEGTEYVSATGRLARIHGYDDGEGLVGREWATCYTVPEIGDTPNQLLTRVQQEGAWRGAGLARTRTGEPCR